MSAKFGYRAVEERYQPSQMLGFAVLAEEQGFEFVCISDHFHPWFDKGGCAGHAWIWLGAAGAKTTRIRLGTGVTTSIYRYHPAIIAQAFATLDELYPGRMFLGIGTGEAMNEMPLAGDDLEWPSHRERLGRTVEAVKIIKALWNEDFVDFKGKYYRLRQAKLYTKGRGKIPIYFAAAGPKAARAAGLYGDGLMSGGSNRERNVQLLSWFGDAAKEGGRRPEEMPKMIEMKISYDEDFEKALDSIALWRPVAGGRALDIADPRELDRLREGADLNALASSVYTSMDALVGAIEDLIRIGFNEIQVGSNSPDEEKFIREFGTKALPYLKDKYSKA
jgi:coenzyme F420-dependent glucose-6-phosphate dehydrogenase